MTEGVINIGGVRTANVALTTTTAANTTLTTSGSYTTSGIAPGDLISGTGISAGTYVVSVESATSLTMNQAATDSTANSRTFTKVSSPVKSIITAKVVSSTSAVTMTACRVRSINNSISLTCVSDDAGWWSVYCH